LAPIAAQTVPGISEMFNVASTRSMLYLGWVIRGLGAFVLVLAYFL
jgi:flagellar biosynthesis component FlhA